VTNLVQVLASNRLNLWTLSEDVRHFKSILLFYEWTVLLNIFQLCLLVVVDVFYSIDLLVFFNNDILVGCKLPCKIRLAGLSTLHFHLKLLLRLLELQMLWNVLTSEGNSLSIRCQVFGLIEREDLDVTIETSVQF